MYGIIINNWARGCVMKLLIRVIFLFSFLALILNPGCGGGSDSGGGGGTAESDYSVLWTGDTEFGAMMLGKSGEILAAMTETDGSGNVIGLTGAVWVDINGGSVTVYLGDDGLPTKAVIGDFILLFSNWDMDAQTVDVAKVYTPTGYIEIFKGVDISSVSGNLAAKLYAANEVVKDTCFPTCETDLKNLSELLKVAGLGLSLGGCAVATTVSLGAAALPCAGLLVGTASILVGDEWWLNNLDVAGDILFATDIFGCATGDVGSCVSVAVEDAARVGDIADRALNSNDTLVNNANIFLTNPATPSGVADGGSGAPPSCASTGECSPGSFVPCWEGVKQCGADCTWGTCYEPCGDGVCDPATGENNTVCPSDCPLVCGDGLCNVNDGETTSNCPVDCSVNSCCVSTGNCPSEQPYECPGSCCCCPSGQTCNEQSICSAN